MRDDDAAYGFCGLMVLVVCLSIVAACALKMVEIVL
jgi:hypothetical protein